MLKQFVKSSQLGFYLGILLFVTILLIPTPEGLNDSAWKTAAVAILMATWWIGEAIPIYATALLPIVLFPVLGIASIGSTTAPYANPLIFLFMGGFIIAIAMQRWNLHKRIALRIVNFVGVKPSSIIVGFIISSAFLSMWVSNTATALMMLPIALSILDLVDERGEVSGKHNFELVLVLCIAYACNIGGMGTLIGTPPNALLAGFLNESYGVEIGFLQWMMVGIPLMLVLLPLMYLLLTKIVYPIHLKELPGGKELIDSQLKELGTISEAEKKVAYVFITTALLWITRPLINNIIPELSDSGIAIAAGVALFIIPINLKKGEFVLEWKDTKKLPWGILILFGGGLSLAAAISDSGLAEWIGQSVGVLDTWPIILLVALIVVIIVFLTEITSNLATTAAFLPVLASVALGLGENPLLLAIPTSLAASCAFMLPVATPPNAIIYGSDRLTIPEMSKAGIWLNFISITIISLAVFTLVMYVFNIELGVLPPWAN
jgi:sodium-dependent dicarboxylate transporter 2/3/5